MKREKKPREITSLKKKLRTKVAILRRRHRKASGAKKKRLHLKIQRCKTIFAVLDMIYDSSGGGSCPEL